jgi:hypothetical protein
MRKKIGLTLFLPNFGTRSKVFKAKNTIIRTFDLVPKLEVLILALDRKFQTIIKTFDLVPKLMKTFGLVFRSSAIRSSDQIPS